jgi:hypothetical protein
MGKIMKRLKKLILFFRPLRRLRNRIDQLELRIKRDNEAWERPAFRIERYSPGDDGRLPDEAIPQVGVRTLVDLKPDSMMNLVKFANEYYESDGGVLEELCMFIETDKGAFMKRLPHDAKREETNDQRKLSVTVKWPRLEVGQTLTVLNAYIVWRGTIMRDMPNMVGMALMNGDALNVQYTFNAP